MYYFTLIWLFFNYLKYCYSSSSSSSILTFSDMLNTKYETIINNDSSNYSSSLLRNTLNNTPTYNEILSDILANMAKSNSYSYEFTNFYFTCEQAFNLLDLNTTTTDRSVISHDLIDCEYYLTETNTFLNTNNNLNVYSLSATSLQIVEVIVGIVRTCSYPNYAIVYARDTFFTEMTQIIVNKLIYSNVNNNNNNNIAKNNLIFSIPINDLNLENLIFSNNSNIKSN